VAHQVVGRPTRRPVGRRLTSRAEWLYLDWASRAPEPLPDNFVHAEWIMLHDNPDFRGFVDFLRAELDRVGPAEADLCRDFFRRAVALELSFFEAAYADRT
jgi:thiaminase/transcriptional activator TenA